MTRAERNRQATMKRRAYVDIETTGLRHCQSELTVVGIALEDTQNRLNVVQLVGEEITASAVLDALCGTEEIYTYNGSRFDLPFIKAKLGINLSELFVHTDLMHECWRHHLKGGLKRVECLLGIPRGTKDIDGWMAVELWWRFVNYRDTAALRKLLDYNAEDILNLRLLRERLAVP
jgi:hypothetical protein